MCVKNGNKPKVSVGILGLIKMSLVRSLPVDSWTSGWGMAGVYRRLIAQRQKLPACGENSEEAALLGILIIHLGVSCFPSFWTAGQLNCLWINSLTSYWLHTASEVHLTLRNPITFGRSRKQSTWSFSKCCCNTHSLPVCLPAAFFKINIRWHSHLKYIFK